MATSRISDGLLSDGSASDGLGAGTTRRQQQVRNMQQMFEEALVQYYLEHIERDKLRSRLIA